MGTVPCEMHTRINLENLMSQIRKRVNPDKAGNYMLHLSRFLSNKLSKQEFTKLCVSTLGPENIPLHNQLIRGIYNNASRSNCPPPSDLLHSLSPYPKKPRSGHIKRKNQNSNQASHTCAEHDVRGNGNVGTSELKTPTQNHEDGLPEQPFKKSRLEETTIDVVSIKGPIVAPLGIPSCPPSNRLVLDASVQLSKLSSSCYDSGDLHKPKDLRRKMGMIAKEHGLNEVSMDCADLLSNGLDMYLKRIIKSCTELTGSRSGTGLVQGKQKKPVNGAVQENNAQPSNTKNSVSLQDFRVAMELNPQNLGKNWPIFLEKYLP